MPSVSGSSMPSMPTLSSGTSAFSSNQTETSSKSEKTSATEKVVKTKAGYALTAETISSLTGNSDLGTLSSLLGNDSTSLYNNLTGISTGLDNSVSDYNTTLLLSQILEKLNKIAENQNLDNSTQSEGSSKEAEKNQVERKKTSSGIVRFRLNNYEYVSSLSDIYISSPEEDGSFFVTGDRTYNLGNQKTRETFYMFFKAISPGNSEILGNYSVAFSIMQDIENSNSFLYKLSSVENLVAQKTGNLVSLRVNNQNIKGDILINLE